MDFEEVRVLASHQCDAYEPSSSFSRCSRRHWRC